jgi:hypothetical protein
LVVVVTTLSPRVAWTTVFGIVAPLESMTVPVSEPEFASPCETRTKRGCCAGASAARGASSTRAKVWSRMSSHVPGSPSGPWLEKEMV